MHTSSNYLSNQFYYSQVITKKQKKKKAKKLALQLDLANPASQQNLLASLPILFSKAHREAFTRTPIPYVVSQSTLGEREQKEKERTSLFLSAITGIFYFFPFPFLSFVVL